MPTPAGPAKGPTPWWRERGTVGTNREAVRGAVLATREGYWLLLVCFSWVSPVGFAVCTVQYGTGDVSVKGGRCKKQRIQWVRHPVRCEACAPETHRHPWRRSHPCTPASSFLFHPDLRRLVCGVRQPSCSTGLGPTTSAPWRRQDGAHSERGPVRGLPCGPRRRRQQTHCGDHRNAGKGPAPRMLRASRR